MGSISSDNGKRNYRNMGGGVPVRRGIATSEGAACYRPPSLTAQLQL